MAKIATREFQKILQRAAGQKPYTPGCFKASLKEQGLGQVFNKPKIGFCKAKKAVEILRKGGQISSFRGKQALRSLKSAETRGKIKTIGTLWPGKTWTRQQPAPTITLAEKAAPEEKDKNLAQRSVSIFSTKHKVSHLEPNKATPTPPSPHKAIDPLGGVD
jgi:hypothetical protein